MSNSYQQLAQMLRTDAKKLFTLEERLAALTGKSGILERVAQENQTLTEAVLNQLGFSARTASAEAVYRALVERLIKMDQCLNNYLGKPDFRAVEATCGKLCSTALLLNEPSTGFFIKQAKAVAMLEKYPPRNLLDFFGYANVAELIAQEGFASVFSALRFAQDTAWMHRFFDEAYQELTAGDFEERPVEIKILEPRWLAVAEKFLEKKYHNVSHLKELGIIFIIPLVIDTPGETVRLFSLLLHYLNEVPFYSRLFRKFANRPDFAEWVKSLLRGDVPELAKLSAQAIDFDWLIIQRYLAKDDEDDPRLSLPHINPEAEHWRRATGDLAKLAPALGADGKEFSTWQSLDWTGRILDGQVVSFDLIDLTMSLVKKGEIKYLYHQSEALWNKVFTEYFGYHKMDELVADNIINGYIKL